MVFTSTELMESMGLKIGDRIKLKDGEAEIYYSDYGIRYRYDSGWWYELSTLVGKDYEIVEDEKRYGDLKCKDVSCSKCPLRAFNCKPKEDETLYEIYKKIEFCNDRQIRNIIKKRLDLITYENDN